MAATLPKTKVEEIAKQLLDAESNRAPIAPLTDSYPGLTVDDAYAIQLAIIAAKQKAGRKVVGKKVGLTSLAMQKMLGVDQPDYGMILDNMTIKNNGTYHLTDLLQPRIEPEIAFMLKADLKGPGITVQNVLDATDYIFPALEVVDSRIKDWKIKLLDTISDNASSSRVVIGDNRVQAKGLDLVNEEVVFEKNGEVLSRAKGEAVLGNPANAVAWVANKLSEFGITLNKGEFIIPGALCAMTPVKAGDTITARFTKVGTVSVKFA